MIKFQDVTEEFSGVSYERAYEQEMAKLFRARGEAALVQVVRKYRSLGNKDKDNIEVYRGNQRTIFYHDSFVQGEAGRKATEALTMDGLSTATSILTAPKGHTSSEEGLS